MPPETAGTVKSRKVGSEDTIVVKLPSERFRDLIPLQFDPPRDGQDCLRAMVVVQDCTRCSFGDVEAGPTQEMHLWVQLGSSPDEHPMEGVDRMLPSMQWAALAAATTNPEVEARFRTFGFDPIRLARVGLRTEGGSLEFPDGDWLEWTIDGAGRGPAEIGVRHRLFLPGHGVQAMGNEVSAIVSGSIMNQPGEIRVHTSSLEPLLLDGERLSALVHRMPKLTAEIVWHRWSKGSSAPTNGAQGR